MERNERIMEAISAGAGTNNTQSEQSSHQPVNESTPPYIGKDRKTDEPHDGGYY